MRFRFYGGPYDGYHDVKPMPVISFPEKMDDDFDIAVKIDHSATLKRHDYEFRKTLVSGSPLKDPDRFPLEVWSQIDGPTAYYEEAYHYIEGR